MADVLEKTDLFCVQSREKSELESDICELSGSYNYLEGVKLYL